MPRIEFCLVNDVLSDQRVNRFEGFADIHPITLLLLLDLVRERAVGTLDRLTPSQRLLDRIHVVHGFTAYQHYGALCDLPSGVNQFVQQAVVADAVATPDSMNRRTETIS